MLWQCFSKQQPHQASLASYKWPILFGEQQNNVISLDIPTHHLHQKFSHYKNLVLDLCCSMSNLVDVQMYLAVDNAGCSPVAQVLCIMSCADFMLMHLHLKAWSSHLSFICEQTQVEVFCIV